MIRYVGFILGCCLMVASSGLKLSAQTLHTQTFELVEILLTSSRDYAQPVTDVTVNADFHGPDGSIISISGFWDGGRIYRVRFAPPLPGTWTFQVSASDPTNAGLNGREGTILASKYEGDEIFKRKGWPKVSPDGRYITYQDSTPLFLLGDTAWEITWKSTDDDLEPYLADRKAKGFNVIQLVTQSHQFEYPWGIENQFGERFVLNSDFSLPNPRYFDYLDEIVKKANDAGMVVSMVPLWGRLIEFVATELGYGTPVTVEEALVLARYTAARYAGSNVMWIAGGDWKYDDPDQNKFWATFARTLKAAGGDIHLTTIHSTGWTGSFDFYGEDATWLDYYMYSVGHYAEPLAYSWQGAIAGYTARPTKPVISGEAQYEDLLDHFWEHHEDTTGVPRIRAVDVREAAYQSIFSGGLAGYIYGANGVWQWSTPSIPGGFGSRYLVGEASSLPGSVQMGLLRRLMEESDWYKLEPNQELLVSVTPDIHVPIAQSQDRMLAYFPANTEKAAFKVSSFGPEAGYCWIDPSTGDSTEFTQVPVDGILSVQPPDGSDWLLSLDTNVFLQEPKPPAEVQGFAVNNFPNPFLGKTTLLIQRPEGGIAEVTIVDALGRVQVRTILPVHQQVTGLDFSPQAGGPYYFRVVFFGASGNTYRATGAMMSLGQ
ncbi:MAG: DUF4038 domain-containing protein [Rhodothermales bacterium]